MGIECVLSLEKKTLPIISHGRTISWTPYLEPVDSSWKEGGTKPRPGLCQGQSLGIWNCPRCNWGVSRSPFQKRAAGKIPECRPDWSLTGLHISVDARIPQGSVTLPPHANPPTSIPGTLVGEIEL